MAKTTFARPYAKAAFAYAKAKDVIADWKVALCSASSIIQNKEASDILFSPTLAIQEKADCLLTWIGGSESQHLKNFFKLLSHNKRLALLPWIAKEFCSMKAVDERIQQIIVYSAYPMSKAHQLTISKKLADRFGQAVSITNTVDPSLIGGMKISAGDWVYDDTLKARIDALSRALIS